MLRVLLSSDGVFLAFLDHLVTVEESDPIAEFFVSAAVKSSEECSLSEGDARCFRFAMRDKREIEMSDSR